MDTYLECLVGFDEHGQPEPLREVGLQVQVSRAVQTSRGTEVVDDLESVKLKPGKTADGFGRIIPNTRVIETSHQGVVQALLTSGQYALTDPPNADKARAATEDHRAARKRGKNRIEE